MDEQNGQVYTHIQAAQIFALYYYLLPEDVRKKALDVLRDEITVKHNGHLATGIFSTKMMLNYLSDQNLDWLNYLKFTKAIHGLCRKREKEQKTLSFSTVLITILFLKSEPVNIILKLATK